MQCCSLQECPTACLASSLSLCHCGCASPPSPAQTRLLSPTESSRLGGLEQGSTDSGDTQIFVKPRAHPIRSIHPDICAVFITMVSQRPRSCSDSVSEPWMSSRPPHSQLQEQLWGGGISRAAPSSLQSQQGSSWHCQLLHTPPTTEFGRLHCPPASPGVCSPLCV